MGVVKLIIEQNNVKRLNQYNSVLDFLLSLYKLTSFKYSLPNFQINNDTLKKNADNIFVNRTNEYLKKLFESISTLYWKGRKWKGTYWPSKWKWYHRHGYWATRKKLLSFDKYRPYRYHEVKGYGKPKLKDWQDFSYYRPLKQTTKFW
ncbi:conserved Plasmodium protein, unknown function [Plasmodium vinckei]|uniref:Uncharacterized protein n=1 Tax=Plasmodium vinckei TaxID=5860 RepID=A0A6V7SXK1_PLAVN|nr:conserved Plasmodium protein, unknown function [Plasmodium vinckei]